MSDDTVAKLDCWLDNSNDRTTAIERRVVVRARDEIVALRRDCSALANWAVPAARAEALEEAAHECDEEAKGSSEGFRDGCETCAAAIRALKDKPA